MFIVICKDGGFEYLPERRRIDAESWDATVQDIANGQFEKISEVICTATNRDVLTLMAGEVQNIWADNGEKLTEWQEGFVADHAPRRRAA